MEFDHGILNEKLKCACFLDTSISWLYLIIANSTQVTAIGNLYSSARPVHIGVPQGSVFGPLLLIICVNVNDLASCIAHCNVSLYVDDTVIYVSSYASVIEDKLNSDLANLSWWLNQNLLTLIETKCKFFIFVSNQKLAKKENSLQINGYQVDDEDSFKYLGVIMHKNITCLDHIYQLNLEVCQRLEAFSFARCKNNLIIIMIIVITLVIIMIILITIKAQMKIYQRKHNKKLQQVNMLMPSTGNNLQHLVA